MGFGSATRTPLLIASSGVWVSNTVLMMLTRGKWEEEGGEIERLRTWKLNESMYIDLFKGA